MNMSDVDAVAKLVERITREAAIDSYPLTWVKLERYAEMSGDTVEAVKARRKSGKWLDGDQCKIVDGRLWVNLPAVKEWVEKWDPKNQACVALNSGKA